LLEEEIAVNAIENLDPDALKEFFIELAGEAYKKKEAEFTPEDFIRLQQVVLLRMIDTKWIEHLDNMDNLREGVGLRGYGGRDPRVEYEIEAFETFQELMNNIQEETVKFIMRARPMVAGERKHSAVFVVSGTNRGEAGVGGTVRKGKKVGRNSPCPCGSGKKYKRCCMGKETVKA